jgi:predicted membrane channel-forming protein YqfA (hemolysin III family)
MQLNLSRQQLAALFDPSPELLKPGRVPRPRNAERPRRPNSYVVTNQSEACRRVLWSNPTPRQDRAKDLLGATGHLERANAWTHLVACVLFCGYAFARGSIINHGSLSSQLSSVSVNVSALTFFTSVMYHIFGTVPGCAGTMRNLDIIAIYASMGVSGAADIALVTNDLANVAPQSLIDPLLAATTLGIFFTGRRILLTPEETCTEHFEDSCHLGLYRLVHSDLEHAGLRAGCMVAMAFQWVLLLPAAFENLSAELATLYFVARLFSTCALMAGVVFDNALLPDQALAGKEEYWDRACSACSCASKRLGCVMGSHAWWHVIALIATLVVTVSREYSVSQMAH